MSKLHRNIFSNYAGFIVNALITLLLTPFLIHHLGAAQYGFWILLNTFIGYFRLMELGIMPAIIRYVSFYWQKEDIASLQEIIGSACLLLLLLSAATLPLLAVCTYRGAEWFELDASQRILFENLFPVIGLAVLLSFFSRLLFAVVEGLQEFLWLNICDASAALLVFIATLALIYSGFGITALFWLLVVQIIYEGLVKYWLIAGKYRLNINPLRSSKDGIRKIWNYSGFAFLTDLAVTISHRIDTLVIGLFLPVAGITHYTIATKMTGFLEKYVNPMISVFFPLASELHAKSDIEALRNLLLRGSRTAMVLLTPGLILGLAYGSELITWWVGEQFVKQALPLFYVFLGVIYFRTWEATASRLLLGMHKVRFNAAVSVLSAIINLSLSLYWVKTLGVFGVAVATLVPCAILNTCVALPYTCSLIKLPFLKFVLFSLAPHLMLSLFFGAGIYVTRDFFISPLWAFISHTAAIALLMLAYIIPMLKNNAIDSNNMIKATSDKC